MINGAAKVLINEFFRRLAAAADPQAANAMTLPARAFGLLRKLRDYSEALLKGAGS